MKRLNKITKRGHIFWADWKNRDQNKRDFIHKENECISFLTGL